ncbi:MAG: DNA polymerase Y family protein [Candidatus Acidiferrales bacterium]
MTFASIHVPSFLVQAVLRTEPALRHRALALVDGTPPLCSVVAANEAAFQAGIDLGMTKSQVAQFCGVEIRHRSHSQEKAAHAALLDLGWSVSPRVEDTAPDTIVLDLAGLAGLFGPDENIAHELLERAAGFGLIARVAVASSIEVAIHAARGFPGITLIPPGEESKRLGSLPVHALSPCAETLETLDRWGVRTCEALAALPVLELSERLGQEGVRLHELARGASQRSLVPAEPDLSFEEEMALEYGVAELEPLSFLLGRLLDQLCARLTARSLAACAIRLRFDLEPSSETGFESPNENSRRSNGSSHKKTASTAYEKALTLPVPVRDSKMLLKLIRLQLQSDPPPAPILKIFIAADPARSRVAQGGLFLPAAPDPEKLELTIARLANLVGDSNIGSPELMDTHRPGEFRVNRFRPARDVSENRRLQAFLPVQPRPKTRRPATTFRIFRPPLPAHVELREGHPVRVGFRGMRGDVIAASGPWRTSGDWWREDAWEHDEWDLEIRFHSASSSSSVYGKRASSISPQYGSQQAPRHEQQRGLYRIYYDSLLQSWFVRGIYD